MKPFLFHTTSHFQLHLHLLFRAQQQIRFKQEEKKLLRKAIGCHVQSLCASLHLSMHYNILTGWFLSLQIINNFRVFLRNTSLDKWVVYSCQGNLLCLEYTCAVASNCRHQNLSITVLREIDIFYLSLVLPQCAINLAITCIVHIVACAHGDRKG